MNGITSSTQSQSLLIALILWQMAVMPTTSYFSNLNCMSETVACCNSASFNWLPYRENDTARKKQFPSGSKFIEIDCVAASCFSTMAMFFDHGFFWQYLLLRLMKAELQL